MTRRSLLLALALALSCSGCFGAARVVLGLPRDITGSGDALEVMLPMRDGTRLATEGGELLLALATFEGVAD